MEDVTGEIKARLAIEDVVGQYIELKRAGRNLKGHSPWGVDRTPSFMVSPEKGIWHDFSSNKGGDIFSFVMEIEGLSFKEALTKLARQAGVELKRYRGGDEAVARRKARMREALDLAGKYYQNCLVRNERALKYVFYKRNLNKKTVQEFKIGYAPDTGRALTDFLQRRGFKSTELEDAGLVNRRGGDLFRGRMMIPLSDGMGGVIGFTGRLLEDKKDAPKYLNTPETLLYNKGRHIFGLAQARRSIVQSGFAVVVEGNMDVISSHQAGVKEAVATAGTAMTEMHLKAFSRMTDDIRLAYDGDEAGVKAAERAIGMASKQGLYLSIIDDYKGAKDADELIQRDARLWQEAVREFRPATEWLLEKYASEYDLASEKGFNEYAKKAKQIIDAIDKKDSALREKYEQMVAKNLGISLEAFRAQRQEKPRQKKKVILSKRSEDTNAPSEAEKNLAALILVGGGVIVEEDAQNLTSLDWPGRDKKALEAKFNRGELELIFEQKFYTIPKEELEKLIAQLVLRVCQEQFKRKKKALTAKIQSAEEAGDEEAETALLTEMDQLLKLGNLKSREF